MQTSLHRQGLDQRSFQGRFFSGYRWDFSYRLSAGQAAPAHHRLHEASWRRSASPLSSVLVTRAVLATALVTVLVTRFSPNSYVFLQIQLFHLSCYQCYQKILRKFLGQETPCKPVCKVRSRLEGFQGRFFWSQLGFWSQAISAMVTPALHRTSRHFSGLLGVRRASLSRILVTGLTLVTALVTVLVTGFSSNSYVFLQIQLFRLSCN